MHVQNIFELWLLSTKEQTVYVFRVW